MLVASEFQIYVCIVSWAYITFAYSNSRRASQPSSENLNTLQEPLGKSSKTSCRLVRYIRTERDKLSKHLFSRALVSSLVDFQKAQVLLMIAVQSSCLWAIHRRTFLVEISSIQQITNTVFFLQIVSWMGVFPVALTLCTLLKANQGSRYVTLLSLGSLFVSLGLSLKLSTLGITASDVISHRVNSVDGLPACGGLPSPLYYCGTGRGDLDISLGRYTDLVSSAIWGLYYTILSLATIGTIAYCFPGKSRVAVLVRQARNRGVARIVRGLSFSIQLLTVAAIGFLLKALLNLSGVRPKTSNTDSASTNLIDTSWTLGQIIAFLTWVPFLIGFIHLLLRESKYGQL
jgi:hypothetical protein